MKLLRVRASNCQKERSEEVRVLFSCIVEKILR